MPFLLLFMIDFNIPLAFLTSTDIFTHRHHSYICIGGSTTPTPTDNIEGYVCPAGHFCVAGALVEEGCPIGTFQPSQGMDNCTVCPAGYMCPDVNMTMAEDCQSGETPDIYLLPLNLNLKLVYMES